MDTEMDLQQLPNRWVRIDLSPKQLEHMKRVCRFHLAESRNTKAILETRKLLHCLEHWPKDVTYERAAERGEGAG